jgi:hypothetical protein
MKSATESTSTFNARQGPRGGRDAQRTWAILKLGVSAAAIVARLRELAPYALIELILPGGSLMALLLWLYRRQRKAAVFHNEEILSLL